MKTYSKLLGLAALVLAITCLSSCGEKEVLSNCKQCSAVQEILQNGTTISTVNVPAEEYCDDKLTTIETTPVIETTQGVGSFSQTTRVTYTCH